MHRPFAPFFVCRVVSFAAVWSTKSGRLLGVEDGRSLLPVPRRWDPEMDALPDWRAFTAAVVRLIVRKAVAVSSHPRQNKKQPACIFARRTRHFWIISGLSGCLLSVFVHQVMSDREARLKLAGLGALIRVSLSTSTDHGAALNLSALTHMLQPAHPKGCLAAASGTCFQCR